MIGLLNINKWPGPTSHDIVQKVKRTLGVSRVGHTGTLDPGAGGVLLVLVGRATRTARFFQPLEKEYRARIVFGVETDSGDADGSVINTVSPPRFTGERLGDVLGSFVGEIEQVPPMVSAVKVGGTRLHKLARKGVRIERPPRKRHVYELALESFDCSGTYPEAVVRVVCETGLYVRVLAIDIAARLGTLAHISDLVRIRIGPFAIRDAVSPDLLRQEANSGVLADHLLPLAEALVFLPRISLDDEQAGDITSGRQALAGNGHDGYSPDTPVLAVDGASGEALAVVNMVGEGKIKPVRVFKPET